MTYEARLRRLEGARTVDVAGTPVVTVPNVIDFVTGPDYLDQRLYPRQATLLKTLFCSPELFTDYDRTVLAEWTDGFAIADRSDGTAGYQGTYGIVGDVKDRIDFCLAGGRRWFREVALVAGRRGSKGFLGLTAAPAVAFPGDLESAEQTGREREGASHDPVLLGSVWLVGTGVDADQGGRVPSRHSLLDLSDVAFANAVLRGAEAGGRQSRVSAGHQQFEDGFWVSGVMS